MPSAHETYAAGAAADEEGRPNDEPTVLVRKLGSTSVPTYLERILTQGSEHRFVVVERLPRGNMSEDETAECVRDAKLAAALEHPNVVRTRAITLRPDEITVMTDYVPGERLSELWSPASGSAKAIPIEIALRILVDAATGLGALHKLRHTEGQERVKFVHGEVTDFNVLVGLDGVSVVLRASRARRRGDPPAMGAGTIAPEVLSGEAVDQRADVYSLGAMLWQALSGRPLGLNHDIGAMLTTAKEGTVSRAVVARGGPWALPLADVAARALSPVPEKRFPTASSMVTELRKIAGQKLATEVEVARFVETAAGEKIAARLADLQASAVIRKASSIPPPRSSPVQAVAVERATEVSEPLTREVPSDPVEGTIDLVPTPIEVRAIEPAEKAPPSATTSPTTEAARPKAFPQLPAEPKKPPPISARNKAARPYAIPELPSESKKPPPVSPTTETARAEPSPDLSPEPPTLVRLPAPPINPSSPSPAAPSKPVAPPKPAVKREGAALGPRPVARAKPAVSAPVPPRSFLARPAARWTIGAYLTIALVTGWFILEAIRNRQDIVTPSAPRVDPSAMPALASVAVPAEAPSRAASSAIAPPAKVEAPSRPAGSAVAPPARVDAGRAAASMASARPAESNALRKAPPPKLPPK